ncbi:Transcriptional regulator MET32 [Hanseniaspora osmophila]|uniref:Transcriptional regulator MET32 n=1 Tax=Hanseniaspora osmophila TaxID=56408 RepID=A0A1E5R8T5_9ASCO|nr:Transcriptional regulator MET32 [Hanseniaspora osmophila]
MNFNSFNSTFANLNYSNSPQSQTHTPATAKSPLSAFSTLNDTPNASVRTHSVSASTAAPPSLSSTFYKDNRTTNTLESQNNRKHPFQTEQDMSRFSQEQQFYQQATEALLGIQKNINQVDPVIKELLKRLQNGDPLLDGNTQNIDTSVSNNGLTNTNNNNNNNNNTGLYNGFSSYSNQNRQYSLSNPLRDGHAGDDQETEYPKGTIFECDLCPQKFDDTLDYRKHCKDHFHKNGDLHICPKCFKGFARKDAMKRHTGTKTCERNRNALIEENGGKMPERPPTERP